MHKATSIFKGTRAFMSSSFILQQTQIFKTRVPHGLLNYKMSNQLLPSCHILLELDFHKLEFYVELKLHELEFQSSGKLLSGNNLKVQFYLSFGRHYHIYFVFILTLTRKYESLQVFSKIY